MDNKSETNKVPQKSGFEKVRSNPWIISTIVFAILSIVLIFSLNSSGGTGNTISEKDIRTKVVTFFKTTQGIDITVNSVEKVSGIYQLNVSTSDGKKGTITMTGDGNYLGSMSNIKIILDSVNQQDTTQETPAEVPKSDKPKVELFVMAYCPYGVKAETNIIPIVNLLKDKIDFNVRYIVSVSGTTIDTAQSLHGLTEAKQDAVQLIIKKNYASKFLAYLTAFNANCYPLGYSDVSKADACWKTEATKLGMNTQTIETAAYGSEGVALLKAEGDASNAAGASGSPTLIINGVESSSIYSGTEATQTAICGAFNKVPTECGTKVAAPSGSSAPSASCG